jgi:hypothetical protein
MGIKILLIGVYSPNEETKYFQDLMKLPSIFKAPRHQRFSIQPRYYDPVKEEIEARIARIRGEMNGEDGDEPEHIHAEYIKSRISSGFQRRTRPSAGKKDNSTILRLVIIGVLFGGVAGFIQYGNDVVYGMLLLVPLYLFLRLKKII